MAQSGYTPIQLYYSTTAAAVPIAGNLANGELAINITDGKLYYKNNSGVVTLLSTAGQWVTSGSDIYYNTGNVSVGTTGAVGKLTLAGAFGTTQTSGLVITSTGSSTGLLSPIAFYLQSSSWGTVHQATITAQQVDGANGGANLIFSTSTTGQFAPTEDFRIASTGAFGLSGANYGSNGQVLTSSGSGAAPTWTTVASGGLQESDVGTAPNQLPLGQMLGSMAFQDSSGISVGSVLTDGSISMVNPGANLSLVIGRLGDPIYYNGIQIFSGYNGSHPSHVFSQDSTNGAFWQAGQGISVLFASGGGGVRLPYNATAWVSASDLRMKNVTGGFSNALDDVAKLQPIRFTWKYDENAKPCVGLSAQSVAIVLPEAIDKVSNPVDKEDKTEYMGVKYTEVIPLLVAAIQELREEIRTLKGL
jgi:hypothetical protein